jgi:hypothetical protein
VLREYLLLPRLDRACAPAPGMNTKHTSAERPRLRPPREQAPARNLSRRVNQSIASSRIQNCFEHHEARRSYTVERLIRRVESGDIQAGELIIGGDLAGTDEGRRLAELAVTVHTGVRAAAAEARQRIARLGGEYAVVGGTSAS